jgi:hypothetical protein
MFEPIVMDGVLENPDFVRKVALKQQYWESQDHPHGGNWPGRRSDYVSVIDFPLFQQMMGHVHDAIGISRSASSYTTMFFQSCSTRDGNSWVHRDTLDFNPTHVGMFYLSPNPPANSGTILYTHKDPDYVYGDPSDDSGNPEDYNVKQVLENRYNRLVVYHPNEFHKSDTYFGSSIDDSRLFAVFFTRVD